MIVKLPLEFPFLKACIRNATHAYNVIFTTIYAEAIETTLVFPRSHYTTAIDVDDYDSSRDMFSSFLLDKRNRLGGHSQRKLFY